MASSPREPEFSDLLQELHNNSSDAPEGVRQIVGRIINHPYLLQHREVGLCTAITSSSHAGAASSRATDGRGPRSLTLREEVRRVFTPTGGYVGGPRNRSSTRQRSVGAIAAPGGQAEKKKKAKVVTKTVILLNKGMTSMPTKKEELYRHKRVASCVEISSLMTRAEVEEKIERLFEQKLGHLPRPRFTFLKAERTKVFPPVVEQSAEWNGARVLNLCGSGNIYVAASGTIGDGFDASLYIDDQDDFISISDDDDLPLGLPEIVHASSASSLPPRVTVPAARPVARTAAAGRPIEDRPLEVEDLDGVVMTLTAEDRILMEEDFQPPPKRVCLLEPEETRDIAMLVNDHLECHGSKECQDVHVSRLRPFRSFCRAFSATDMHNVHLIQVKFFDSMNTVDDGGPKRDFLHRLLQDLLKPSTGIFLPTENGVTVSHNAEKLEKSLYQWAGRALALMVLTGGPSVAVLSPAVYQFVTEGFEATSPEVSEVPLKHVRDIVKKIQDAESDEELKSIIVSVDPITMEDTASILMAAGVSTVMKVCDVRNSVRRLTKYYALGMYRSELEDFQKGMECYNFLKLLRSFPSTMRPVLVAGSRKPVTGSELLVMFQPVFSEQGSNQRLEEEDVMELWTDYLRMVEEGLCKVSAPEILRFASGLAEVPLVGWGVGKEPSLMFENDPKGPLPTSSTCGPTIVLPLWRYKDAADFKDQMDTAVICSPFILRD